MKKVSVLITTVNIKDALEVCLISLKSLIDKGQNLEVIVIDDESTDGTQDMVKDKFPWVILLSTPNYGLAYASNMGVKRSSGEYLLFFGYDSFAKEDTIPGLIEYLENNSEVGMVTPILVMRDGKPDMDVHRRFPTPMSSFSRLFLLSQIFPKSKLFNSYFMADQDLNKAHEIDICISHFMLLSRKIFDKVGGFDDKNYFAFGEDVDICYQVKQAGYKIMYLPQFVAEHWKGTGLGTRASTSKDVSIKSLAWKNFIHLNSTRAMRVFLHKNYINKYPLPLIWFMDLGTYVLQFQRQIIETFKHIKRFGFKFINDDYTKTSRRLLKERFGF